MFITAFSKILRALQKAGAILAGLFGSASFIGKAFFGRFSQSSLRAMAAQASASARAL